MSDAENFYLSSDDSGAVVGLDERVGGESQGQDQRYVRGDRGGAPMGLSVRV